MKVHVPCLHESFLLLTPAMKSVRCEAMVPVLGVMMQQQSLFRWLQAGKLTNILICSPPVEFLPCLSHSTERTK